MSVWGGTSEGVVASGERSLVWTASSCHREDQTTHNIGKCHDIVAVVVIGQDDLKQPTATSTMFFSAGAVGGSL